VVTELVPDGDLQSYVDGDLETEREAILAQNLAASPADRRRLDRLQDVIAALDTWPIAREPPHLARQIMAGVRASPQLRPVRLRWVDLIASAAAGAVAYLAGLLWFYLVFRTNAPPQVAAALAWLSRFSVTAVHHAQKLASSPALTWGLLSTAAAAVAAGLTLPFWYPTLREEALSLVGIPRD
jgi:anti-sigma factor RsiW